jgi:cytochrome c biogenesis factor
MQPTWNIVHLAIYATMALYAAAAILFLAKVRRAAWIVYGAGCAVAAAGWGYRWGHAGHVPLQNLFEVFLTLGVLMFPITLFSRRFLEVGAEWADAVIGLVVLVPAGFVFSADPKMLPPALQSFLFVPHVASYMFAYVVMGKAGCLALGVFVGTGDRRLRAERDTHVVVRLGFPLLTLGLVLGAVWGKLAWGDYWNWDPKELWSLVSWLVFLGYFHFRYLHGKRYPRANASLVLAGVVAIVLTLLWVNLARIFGGGLHSYAT